MFEDPMRQLPADPFALHPPAPFRPADRRSLSLLGGDVELLWLPERKARGGVPSAGRPAFVRSVAERILEQEALWRGADLVLTPNRYPFAARQLVLWSAQPVRDVTLPMLDAALALEQRCQGTLLLNSVGAAASIPRAHVHLVADRLPFLDAMPQAPWRPAALDVDGVDCVRLLPPFPALVVGLRGAQGARARAVHRLLELRTTAAVNLVSSRGTTWLMPRSPIEIPAPHFPHALGAAELWGRWCYADEAAFRAARVEDLVAALRLGGLDETRDRAG
jgi:hypothetical protein